MLHAYQGEEADQACQHNEPAKTAQFPTQAEEQQKQPYQRTAIEQQSQHLITSFL
jgi:hypothetical protein